MQIKVWFQNRRTKCKRDRPDREGEQSNFFFRFNWVKPMFNRGFTRYAKLSLILCLAILVFFRMDTKDRFPPTIVLTVLDSTPPQCRHLPVPYTFSTPFVLYPNHSHWNEIQSHCGDSSFTSFINKWSYLFETAITTLWRTATNSATATPPMHRLSSLHSPNQQTVLLIRSQSAFSRPPTNSQSG